MKCRWKGEEDDTWLWKRIEYERETSVCVNHEYSDEIILPSCIIKEQIAAAVICKRLFALFFVYFLFLWLVLFLSVWACYWTADPSLYQMHMKGHA